MKKLPHWSYAKAQEMDKTQELKQIISMKQSIGY